MTRFSLWFQITHTITNLSRGIFQASCIMAIHLTISILRIVAHIRPRHSRPTRNNDAVLVGVLTTIVWSAMILTILISPGGSEGLFLPVLILTLPLTGVIGWQVGKWRRACLLADRPSSLVLGHYRTSTFMVSQPFVISAQERLKHLAIQGPTGSGKSTLLKNLIIGDIRSGAGLCAIDPKDNLIDGLLPNIPQERWDDVIILDATDTEMPLGFNPLSGVPANRRSLATSETLAVLRRYFSDSWGARLEHILGNVILALLETPQSTLLDVRRLLLDADFRQQVVRGVTNVGVQQFFSTEFEQTLSRRSDTISPILNKVGPWLTYPELRYILGQTRSSFSLRQVMDEGKILLVRIPEGTLGEDVSSLLGALIVAKIQMAAHSRVDIPEGNRRPFYLYVDEFQNFATSSFAKILAEARSFRLGLVCANQFPEQLTRDLQLAIVNNVATNIRCFREQSQYRVQVSLLEGGNETPEPNILTPFPPLPIGNLQVAEQIRLLSRTNYGRSRENVEEQILRRLSNPNYGTKHQPVIDELVDVDEA